MAGAAIGVSHLVQSTRAGADFGFALLWLVVLVNIIKYPFFEFGHRYPAASGENLLDGYKRLGKHYLVLFLMLNIITGIGSVAAVFFVTGSIMSNIFDISAITGENMQIGVWSAIIMMICIAIYMIGRFHMIDIVIKVLIAVLFLATTFAFFVSIGADIPKNPDFISKTPWDMATIGFLLALMGWMPGPVEMSAWQSLWFEAKEKDVHHKIELKDALVDFRIGYVLCIVLAIMFVTLGANIMHGSGNEFAGSGAQFASQVINLYVTTIGEWSYPIIALAAFCAMFSTSFTLLDAYPRSLAYGFAIIGKNEYNDENICKNKNILAIIFAVLALIIIFCFVTSLKLLVDIVTIIAFVAGFFFAAMNLRLVTCKHMPEEAKPGKFLMCLAIIGLIFLAGFSLVFLWSKL